MSPAIAKPVAEVFAWYPEPQRGRFMQIRQLIFDVAAQTDGVGTVTECLKWGEPAYLTQESRSGSTLRLGTVKSAPQACAVLFNCQTTLIETFGTMFEDVFVFDKNRALILPNDRVIPRDPLALCLQAALIYHVGKRRNRQNPIRNR